VTTPTSDWALFDRGQIEPPLLAQRIAARTGLAPADVRSVIDAIPLHLQPLPQSVALLAELACLPPSTRPRLLFLSNMPRPYARHMQAAYGFFAHFEDGLFSGDVAVMKPEGEMWRLADQRFGLAHGHTMFLDDHEGNVLAARAHGWQAIQFHTPEQVRPELMPWLLA
jgi:putative hydrolase of the HAD superfamily